MGAADQGSGYSGELRVAGVASLECRAAGQADLPGLLPLYRDLNPNDAETGLADAERNWLLLRRYPGSEVFLGCVGESIVTSCTLVVIPNLTRGGTPYGLIENVVTAAAYRRRGFGAAVIAAAVAAAWQAACYKVMLLTGSKEPATLKFYHDCGFEQTKTGFQIRRIPVRGA